MDIKTILSHCDHTVLSPSATINDIKIALDDAVKYKTASVCIPPCYVKYAKEYVGGMIKICTVIGFPNGYSSLEVKLFEALNAINDGADELDMVMNIGQFKAKNYDFVLNEIQRIKALCEKREKDLKRRIILKVIIETCLLTDREKIKACKIVELGKADYIKTSTGFSLSGATKEDVKILLANSGKVCKVKAAGGISTIEDAEEFLDMGCDRLGTSRIVNLVKEREIKK